MVGREAERVLLREQLASMRSGRGQLVILGGEAGIGKTTLARDLMDTARDSGCMVLVGRSFDSTTASPYALWLDLASHYLRTTNDPDRVAVPPVLANRTLDGITNQAEFYDLVRLFLQDVSKRQPTLIVLEDAHWTDPASLELLRYIAPHVTHDRLLLVVTYRVDELTRQNPFYRYLPALVREAEGLRLDLRRLRQVDLDALVTTRYRLAVEDRTRLVTYLTRHSDGNPFFAMELLRTLEHLDADGLHESVDGWLLGELERVVVPGLVSQIIDARVSRLGEVMREPLAIAAVIGQEVPLALWSRIASLDDDAMLGLLDDAVGSFLVTASPDGVSMGFVHALTRETLYQSFSPPRRRRIHRAVAEALIEDSSWEPDPIAFHFQQAGDDRAVGWLIRAGERAQRAYAWLMAGDRFLSAADLLQDVEGEELTRARLLYRFARLQRYSNTVRGVESLQLAERLAERAGDHLLAADAAYSRGILHCFAGEWRTGLAEIEAGIEALERLPISEVRTSWIAANWMADALPLIDLTPDEAMDPAFDKILAAGMSHRRGTIPMFAAVPGYLEQAETISRKFLQIVEGVAAGPLVMSSTGHTLFGLGVTMTTLGRPAEARQAFAAANERYDRLDHHAVIALTLLMELTDCLVPYFTTDRAERQRVADEAQLSLDRAGGAFPAEITANRAQLVRMYFDGKWDEVRAMAGSMEEHGMYVLRRQSLLALAPIALHQGDHELAWSFVRAILPQGPETQPGNAIYLDGLMLQRLAVALSLEVSDLETALAWLRTNDAWLAWNGAALGLSENCVAWAQYFRALGDTNEAVVRATQAVTLASDPHQPLALVSAHLELGELALDRGDSAVAEESFGTALVLATACEIPFERARVLTAMLQLPASTSRQSSIRSMADEARFISTQLGAKPLLAKINLRMPSEVPPSGLTSRELDVLRLAANGLTDAEIGEQLFISARTSSQHLRSIYGKLQIHSRAALTRYAIEHRLA